jgi:hypothetical protein
MWATLAAALGTNNHSGYDPGPTRLCFSVLVTIIAETLVVYNRIGEHYVRPFGSFVVPNCFSKDPGPCMSSGKGGGTQRSFFGFSPNIESILLLSSSKGILNGRGLDPLLIF